MPRRDRRPSNFKRTKNVCGSLDSPFTQVKNQERPTRSCTCRATFSEITRVVFIVSLLVRTQSSMYIKHSSRHVCLSEKRIMHANDAMPIIHFRRMQPDGYSSRALGVGVSFWLGRLLIIHICMCRTTGPWIYGDAKRKCHSELSNVLEINSTSY